MRAIFDGSYQFDSSSDEFFLDDLYAEKIDSGKEILVRGNFNNWREVAKDVNLALGISDFEDFKTFQNDANLWGWFAMVFWEVWKKMSTKPVEKREIHSFVPAPQKDWRKYQRHLVRTPSHLYAQFGSDADHFLCGNLGSRGELFEQLTSKQEFWRPNFMKITKLLYYDKKNDQLKTGAGSKIKGAPRRLKRILDQFDITWEIEETTPKDFVRRLPKEFDRFK